LRFPREIVIPRNPTRMKAWLFAVASFVAFWYPVATVQAAAGDLDLDFDPSANATVRSLSVQADGSIVSGGSFTMVGGQACSNLVRLLPSGEPDPTFVPMANAPVYSTTMQRDGKIIVAGEFTTINGAARGRIARLNSDGTLDPAFNATASSTVYSTVVQSDGKILMGGDFTVVNGVTRNQLARLNANGSIDTGFTATTNDDVDAIAIQTDGSIVIAGPFTTVSGISRTRIARLSAAGTIDATFNPGASGGAPHSAAIQADGKILVGGQFTSVAGVARNSLARINSDGSLDMTFNPNVNANVLSIVVQADGKIIIAGDFTAVDGVPRSRIARLNSDGTLDSTWDTQMDNSAVTTSQQADGKVLIGGGFLRVGGITRSRMARLENDPATELLTVTSSSRIEWLRGGSAPEAQDVTFEFSEDGTMWSSLGGGRRISGGWEITDLSLPPTGKIRAQARIVGNRYNGSSGLVQSLTDYPHDRVTEPPVLFAPASDQEITGVINISYTLPEAALVASAKLIFTRTGAESYEYLISGTEGNAGPHQFDFYPWDPKVAPQIIDGVPLPDGRYDVSVVYRDSVGNPESSSDRAADVVVDNPPSAAVQAAPNPVQFRQVVSFDAAQSRAGRPDLTLVKYEWDFDYDAALGFQVDRDTGETANTTFAFDSVGSHIVAVRVTDSNVPTRAAIATTSVVAEDKLTEPPVLTAPISSQEITGVIFISYMLPESALSSSVKLIFARAGGESHEFGISGAGEKAGLHQFGFQPWEPLTSPQITHGAALPDGVYDVTVVYRDAGGNPEASSNSATGVLIRNPPAAFLQVTPNPVALRQLATFDATQSRTGRPDLTFITYEWDFDYDAALGFVVDRNTGAIANTGFAFDSIGSHVVAVRVTDSNAPGRSAMATASVLVERIDPETAVLFSTGAAVPGAGDPASGIPAGSFWRGFGPVAINNAADLAFVATLSIGESKSKGLFFQSGESGALRLVAQMGGPVTGGTFPSGATWKSFKDPVLAEDGSLAWIGTVAGSGVTAANDAIVVRWTSALESGGVNLIARESESGPGTIGSRWAAFQAVERVSGATALRAKVRRAGSPAAVATAWAGLDTGALRLLAFKGAELTGIGRMKAFTTLKSPASSRAQSRNWLIAHHADGGASASLLATLTDGRKCAVAFDVETGVPNVLVQTGSLPVQGLPELELSELGLPAFAESPNSSQGSGAGPDHVLFRGIIGKRSRDAAIFEVSTSDSGARLLARVGDVTPNTDESRYAAFGDPVLSIDGSQSCWLASILGDSVTKHNNDCIFFQRTAGGATSMPQLLAREGSIAPGTTGSWHSFTSIAAPTGDMGPLFVATLALNDTAGVNAANASGLWGLDSRGQVRLLFRNGQPLEGITVRKFFVLDGAGTAFGGPRSFNDEGKVVIRVMATDGTQHLVGIQMP
jgi:uncharacterized delta-60 repeat protein